MKKSLIKQVCPRKMNSVTIRCQHCKQELTIGCLATEFEVIGAYKLLVSLYRGHLSYCHSIREHQIEVNEMHIEGEGFSPQLAGVLEKLRER